MTRVWLVRHGAHDWLGKSLVGRAPGISLNSEGHKQAELVAQALESVGITSIYSSPMERACETAIPLAGVLGVGIEIDECLNEIDFGEWTNVSFEDLSADPLWDHWNAARAKARVPGGESMREVQRRVIRLLERLTARCPQKDVALFSHGDVIKAALCWHLGMSLDSIHLLDVAPGGLAVLDFLPGRVALRALKRSDALFDHGFCTVSRLPSTRESVSWSSYANNPDSALAPSVA